MTIRTRIGTAIALAFAFAGCSNAPVTQPPATTGHTFPEVALLEQTCMQKVQSGLVALDTKRMDTFFSAALNGLVDCEASSGLAHVPTKDVSTWLERANGKAVAIEIPKSPILLAKVPATDDARLPYQRACVAYMRRYLPRSIANAGDDPDVAAAYIFNALEECDSDSGFATIEPNKLADIMKSKKLL